MELLELNVLVLDYVLFFIDGGIWEVEMEILCIDNIVREWFGLFFKGEVY